MPAILAHWAVAKDVAWRFIRKKKPGYELFQGKSDDRYEQISRYLYFGANGPDLPYCRDTSGKSKWADLLHYNKQGEFLLQLILIAKKISNDEHRDRTMAYVLGHATHIAADSMVHPYVNCFAGAYHNQVIPDIHKISECHQDSFLAKEYYGRKDVHTGSSWIYFVPSATQLGPFPAMAGITILSDETKEVLKEIDKAFKNTHGNSPGLDYLKNCYENYYDVVLDEGYDKGRILWAFFLSPVPTDPHMSLVQHDEIKSHIKYYPELLRKKAVSFAEKLCNAVLLLYQSACSEDDQNKFRSTVKNWNLDCGYWIDVKLEGKNLKIIWKHTWC